MKKNEFDKKYDAVIKLVAIENEVDMSVGRDMLISSIRGQNGEGYTDPNGWHKYDTYAGVPADFDYVEAYADYKAMVEVV